MAGRILFLAIFCPGLITPDKPGDKALPIKTIIRYIQPASIDPQKYALGSHIQRVVTKYFPKQSGYQPDSLGGRECPVDSSIGFFLL